MTTLILLEISWSLPPEEADAVYLSEVARTSAVSEETPVTQDLLSSQAAWTLDSTMLLKMAGRKSTSKKDW